MRKGLLAKIHIGKADLGIDNEEWRKMILEISNNRTNSTKELKMFELEDLLRKLKGLGFYPIQRKATPEQQQIAEQAFKLDMRLEKLIKTLNLNKNYISAMAKNMFSIRNTEYLQNWQKEKIIKTLENRKLKAKNDEQFS